MNELCIACGKPHKQTGRIGEPGTFFAGVQFLACPNLPDGYIYWDTQHKTGPRGSLFKVIPERFANGIPPAT